MKIEVKITTEDGIIKEYDVSDSLLLDDTKLKQLIWEDWESEIKEEDPRQMVLKYMKLMRDEFIKNKL